MVAFPAIPFLAGIGARAIPFAARGIKGLLGRGGVPRSARPTFNIPTLGATSPAKRLPFIPRNLKRVVPQGVQNSLPPIALNNRLLRNPIQSSLLGGVGYQTAINQFGGGNTANATPQTPDQTPAPTQDVPTLEAQTAGMTPEQLDALLLEASGGAPSGTDNNKKNIFQGVSNVLSDPDRLQRIITGISLLEGTPVEEAVQLGSAVGAISGGGSGLGDGDRVEVVDRETGEIVFNGTDDSSQLRQFANQPNRYQILDAGTMFEMQSDRSAAREEAQLDTSIKGFEALQEAAIQSQEVAGKVDQVLALLESGELETGTFAGIGVAMNRLVDGQKATNADLLNSLQTQLAVLQRVPGSGQTSDIEFKAYRDAVVGLNKTEDYNKSVLRKLQVANRLIETRLSYIDKKVFDEGKSFSQASNEFTALINDKDGVTLGKIMDVGEVIFDASNAVTEKGKTYLFLDPNNQDTYNQILIGQ